MPPKYSGKADSSSSALLPILVSVLTVVILPFSVHIIYQQWNHSLLRAPVCRAPPPSAAKLPKMVVLLGTEGGGHDLFEYIFAALPTAVTIERFDPKLHLTNSPKQETAPADHKKPPELFCPQLPYARRVHDFGVHVSALIKEKVPTDEGTYVRVRDPMPMGRVRTPLARLDPVSLATFHGLYYDLRVIVLIRNITRSVMWSVARNFHNEDIGLQLRLLEDSLTYMDASIRTLPCNTYALVDVDWLEPNTLAAAGELAKFLDLPKINRVEMAVALQVALTRWDNGQAKGLVEGEWPAEPTFNGQKVEAFFNQRTGLWPLLEAARHRPIFVPSSVLSWPRSF